MPRPEFSEEYQEELDRTLRQVHKNDMVSVVYFSRGEFRKVTGIVSRIDPTAKVIRVVDTKIPMGDIYEIEEREGEARGGKRVI